MEDRNWPLVPTSSLPPPLYTVTLTYSVSLFLTKSVTILTKILS